MRRFSLVVLALILAGRAFAAAPAVSAHQLDELDELDEVVVEGRVPGPPLWKISKGDHVLWMLPLVDIYPKNIDWDSTRAERLLAGSQEYLYRPRNGAEFSRISSNPLTVISTLYAGNKLTHLPHGQTLSDLLPPDLYRRLLALKSRYFPGRKISDLTIWEARRVLEEEILDHEKVAMLSYTDLTSPLPITKKLLKWLNRRKIDRRTNTSYFVTSEIALKELKKISKAIDEVHLSADALNREVACLEKSIAYFERDFGSAKRRANAWAQGRADDLLNPAQLYTESDSCRTSALEAVFKGNAAMEQFIKDNPAFAPDYAALDQKRREHWLAAAERALTSNTKTFGVLAVDDILGKESLVAVLEARSYKVEVSAR